MLIAARFLQGVGSAMASAVVLGILVTLFTEPGERAKAIGVFSFTGAAGASIGQVLGGVLTDALSWHWIFFINLPIGLATIALAIRVLPGERGAGLAAGADVIGAALVTGGLMLGIYTVVKIERVRLALGAHPRPRRGRRSPCSAAFVVRQATARTPLMPLRIFRSRNVVGRQPGPDADAVGAVRLPDHRRALPAEGPRLRRRSTPAWRCFPRRWPSAACPWASPPGSTPASASAPSCWPAWCSCSGRSGCSPASR